MAVLWDLVSARASARGWKEGVCVWGGHNQAKLKDMGAKPSNDNRCKTEASTHTPRLEMKGLAHMSTSALWSLRARVCA